MADVKHTPWRPIDEAPRDGSAVWAFLYETGIRLVRWMSPEECAAHEGNCDVEDYDGCWVELTDEDEEWSPELWAPLAAMPMPDISGTRLAEVLAKAEGRS